MGSAESWYLRVSGCGRRRGRIKCQSIFLSQADRHLWDKVVFINTIFSKPHCHTGKHTFNKMPFSNCSQFPALPFGRGKVVFMMWTYSTEKNRWVLDSQQKQRIVIGMDVWQVTKRVILKSGRFFQDCHSLSEILFSGGLQSRCPHSGGHSHISLRFIFYIHSIHEYRVGKDQILAGLRYAYAILDKDFLAVS